MNPNWKQWQSQYTPPKNGWWDKERKAKIWYKSKSVWAAVVLFSLSLLVTIGTFPSVVESPYFQGVVGMIFSILWVLLRMLTDQPITPNINLPNPKDLFKK